MRRAGVLPDVQKEGYVPGGVCWREFDGTYIAGIKSHMDDRDVMVCLPLDKLIRLYYRHFVKLEGTELLWQHKVVGLEQDEAEARAVVGTPEGTKTLGADYVLGCDGANSQVRKSLFGKDSEGVPGGDPARPDHCYERKLARFCRFCQTCWLGEEG
jgi:2-polyprenyl-6-methoxyphenol hydroxylase-like FAD-dependent oxidoreductase